jgi:hypothetical protein
MIPGHSPARQPENRDEGPMTPGLAHEHGVLMRQMGGLQSRCTELLRSSASRVAALEGDNLRLRAELVLLRTSVFWGLGAATGGARHPRSPGRDLPGRLCGPCPPLAGRGWPMPAQRSGL